MYDLIVIGGGPAGLTATIYAIRKRLNVLLISPDLGGKANWRMEIPGVDEYHQIIKGLDVVNKFKSELEYLDFARNMEFVDEVVKVNDHFEVKTMEGGDLLAKAVIIATGANQQFLDVPGEQEYLMRGLSYSALSYAPMFIDKKAVVVGDGDLALRSTAELATVAEKVHLVTQSGRGLDTPLGIKIQAAENVVVLNGYEVLEVKGNGYAEDLVVQDQAGKIQDVKVDGIFVERALVPNANMVEKLVEFDEFGRIIVDCQGRTNVPGIFAAGDVTNSTEQILVAVGEGVSAAISAYNYLLPAL